MAAFLGRRADKSQTIVPSDSIQVVGLSPSINLAVSEGVRSHPAYLAQIERCNQAGVRLAYAKGERLPQPDLEASYGLNGLANTFKGTLDEGLID